MSSHCTCGSPVPSWASFCPRCGRPLAPGIGEPAEPPQAQSVPEVEFAEPARPGREAYLRAAFAPALFAALARYTLSALSPWLAILSYLILFLAGFLTVLRFKKRNAAAGTSVWLGFGLGALTGVLCFVPSLLLQVSVLAGQGLQGYLDAVREQAGDFPMTAEMMRILEEPGVLATVIAFSLVLECVILLGATGAGGALAARRFRDEMEGH